MRTRAVYSSLRRRADFTRVHEAGRRRGDALLQVRVVRRPANVPLLPCPIRLGIQVSKRHGGAVARNRFKRIVRAAVCALATELADGWDVLVLPRAVHDAKMADVRESLRALLRGVGVIPPPDETGPA
jgi:ribonuclease P protein component